MAFRQLMLLMLFVTLLAPVFLYHARKEDISSLTFSSVVRKRNLLPQEFTPSVSRSDRIIYVENPSTLNSSSERKTTSSKQSDGDNAATSMVRNLRDQLIRAKTHLSLSSTKGNPQWMREIRVRMKEIQRALGEASTDRELPRNAHEKWKAMELTLAKGRQVRDECPAMVKKLRAMLHLTEEQLRIHRKQTLFLTQLTAKTLPKGLHCLPLRLSSAHYSSNLTVLHTSAAAAIGRPYHYAVFTDNVLAAAVVVNSTVQHAADPEKHAFHVVTDRLNHAAMSQWFAENPAGRGAAATAVEVRCVDEFSWLNSSYSPAMKQMMSPSARDYYFGPSRGDGNPKYRNPKYLSILNHLRFYLPEIFPELNKVLFLDDDVVVRKDLSPLWSVDMKGNVNGAVETCGRSFHRFDRYLNFSHPLIAKNFDPRACAWAYGMNIFDLREWRRQNVTQVYHEWQRLNHNRQLWKLGTLPAGLMTFWGRTYPLEKYWHVLGLGYDPNVRREEIERAAVLHYNGNMKPWLEIGIPRYRTYWSGYLDYDNVYLRECNINP